MWSHKDTTAMHYIWLGVIVLAWGGAVVVLVLT